MLWQVYTFAVLPLVGALVVSLSVRTMRNAVIVALSLGLVLLLLSYLPGLDLRPLFPALTGGIVAGIVLSLVLWLRAEAGVALRVGPPLVGAAVTHWSFLNYVLGTR